MQVFKIAIVYRFVMTLFVIVSTTGVLSAQGERVVFSGDRITVGKAMSEIENQTLYIFAFNTDQLDTDAPVKLDKTVMTVSEALPALFDQLGCKYVVRERFIAISPDAGNPERANVVARAQDNEGAVTEDRRPVDAGREEGIVIGRETVTGKRDDAGEQPYEVIRTVTIMPGEPVTRNYPASYSAYEDINRYAANQNVLPVWAVKTNLLYGGLTLTPNLGVEFGIDPRSTIEITGSHNNRNRKKESLDDRKQLMHWGIRGEYRRWFCERYNGHFLGAHLLWTRYNISSHKIPLLFEDDKRYDGFAVGAGISYGYNMALGKRWGLEFHIGAGVAYMNYDMFTCEICDRDPLENKKLYFGPTRAGVNLVFMIK